MTNVKLKINSQRCSLYTKLSFLTALLAITFLTVPSLSGNTERREVPAAPVQTLPQPKHIVIVIEENKGFDDIIKNPNAPYLNSLVKQGGSLPGLTRSIIRASRIT